MMFLFTTKCPVNPEEKVWIDESMRWLIEEFGADRLRESPVILPTEKFFPDPYSGDKEDVRALVDRVCSYMGVDSTRTELEFYSDRENDLRGNLPAYESSHEGAAGHYRKRRGKFIIGLEAAQLGDPMSLVATVAHELGHVLLLGEGRVSANEEDHEPLTDLLTVFIGMGVFTGNAVFGFRQWTDSFSQGWETHRRGYLTEEMFGYALALFAWLRSEDKPVWSRHLEGNVSAYFKSGHKYLEKTGDTALKRLER